MPPESVHTPESNWHLIAAVCANFVLVLGGLVLVGWLTGQTVLVGIVEGWATTTPTTAIGLIAMALAVRCFRSDFTRSIAERLALGLASTAIALALLAMVQHALGDSWAMNRWWFGMSDSQSNGLMSIATAWGFLISGGGILLMIRLTPGRHWAVSLSGVVTGTIGFAGVLAYISHVETLQGIPGFETLAFPTAMGFVLLGAALISLPKDNLLQDLMRFPGFHGLGVRVLLPIVLALPLLLGWVVFWIGQWGVLSYEVAIAVAMAVYGVVTGLLLWRTRVGLESARLQRELAEKELRKSERWGREMVHSLPQAVWTCLPDGECDYLSPQWEDYTGKSFAEQKGFGWLQAVHPDDRDRVNGEWQATAKAGDKLSTDYRLLGRDGTYRWFHALANPVRNGRGEIIKWFGSSTDIDDMKIAAAVIEDSRKQLEELVQQRTQQIVESQEALAEAQAVAKLGSWSLEVATGAVKWSEELFKLFALPPNDHAPDFGVQESLFTPESWSRLQVAVAESIKTGEGYVLELNFRRHDGVVRWAEARSEVMLDPQGQAVRLTGTFQDITENRETRLALDEATKRLTLAVASARIGVWDWDIANDTIVWDQTMRELYGSREGLADLQTWKRTIAEEDRASVEAAMKAALAGDENYDTKFTVRHDDGKENRLHGRAIVERSPTGEPIRMIGVTQDITNEWVAHRELEAKERLMRQFVEDTPAAMAMLDRELRYVRVSKRWKTDYRLGQEECVGRSHLALVPNQPKGWVDQYQQVLNGKKVITGEDIYPWKDGGREWILWEARPWLLANGQVGGVLLLTQFVTQRKEMELQLRQREHQLNRSNQDLEQFAYVASHDLQEPLRAVSGCVQLLERRYGGKLDDAADELIQHTVEGAERMQQLIHDLLTYSRVGSAGLSPELTSMREPLNAAMDNLRAAIDESNAVIEVSGDFPELNVDPMRITQLFQNLLGNALKYQKLGSIPRIVVSAHAIGEWWEFTVRDNGLGIAPEHFSRIFEIFQRLHTRTEYAGSGIGLSICSKIVDRHGGRIWVEAVPDSGAIFKFNLPRNNLLSS